MPREEIFGDAWSILARYLQKCYRQKSLIFAHAIVHDIQTNLANEEKTTRLFLKLNFRAFLA